MDKYVIVKRKDFDSFETFKWWFLENNISGNCLTNWELLCMYGEISLLAVMQDV